MKLLILIAMILSSSWAQDYKVEEKDCSPVDIRDHHPHLRKHFSTPLSQGKIGWCYGFAAADLLSTITQEPVSPNHVAAIYNKSVSDSIFLRFTSQFERSNPRENKEIYEGGFIKKAIKETIKEKSVCSHSDLPSHSWESNYYMYNKILQLEKLKEEITKSKEIQNCERLGTDEQLNELIDFIKSGPLNKVFEKHISKVCEGKEVSVPKVKVKNFYHPAKIDNIYQIQIDQYKSRVNRILNKGLTITHIYIVVFKISTRPSHLKLVT